VKAALTAEVINRADMLPGSRGAGDPKLAALMRQTNPPAPVEAIVETDILLTITNRLSLAGRRIVRLACGHRCVTRNWKRAKCTLCHQMIMNGEDYHAFRFPPEEP
jgi:hypothetical protein